MTPPRAPLAAFGAVWACYFAGIAVFNPYAPLWFKELGFSTLAIGALASLQAWTRVFAPYAWAWLGDHGGERVALVRRAALAALLAAAALLAVRGYAAVAACTLLLFAANAAVVPLCEAALAARITKGGEMDAGAYGRVRVWGSVGFIVAVLAAGALLDARGIGAFPLVVTAGYALLFAATLALPSGADAAPAGEAAAGVWAVLRRPAVAWFFASIFFTVLAHTALYTFFSLYLDRLGYPKWAVGALWAVSVAMEIVFFWFQGRWLGRLAAHRWLHAAAGASALRFAAVAAFGGTPAVLVATQALHSLSFAGHHAACILLVNRHFPGRLRGRGQALYTVLGYGLSGVAGGLGGGALASAAGFEAVFWAAAGTSLVAWACVSRSLRHEHSAAG